MRTLPDKKNTPINKGNLSSPITYFLSHSYDDICKAPQIADKINNNLFKVDYYAKILYHDDNRRCRMSKITVPVNIFNYRYTLFYKFSSLIIECVLNQLYPYD